MKKVSKLAAAEEAIRCLVCYDGPCTKACPQGQSPDKLLRSLRFRNFGGVMEQAVAAKCKDCSTAFCEEACNRWHMDWNSRFDWEASQSS